MADNTALMQIQNNSKQIDQLRTEIDNIKAGTSPLRQLMAENPYLIEQLRSLLPGEWDVDDIYSICMELALDKSLVSNLVSSKYKADELFERNTPLTSDNSKQIVELRGYIKITSAPDIL